MTKQELQNILYKKYIEPTENKQQTFIGVEIEMPVVNLDYRAVNFDVLHSLTAAFMDQFGFTAANVDECGHIYSAQNSINGDVFSYDCSYNNLELSFGKENNLNVIHERFIRYYSFIQDFLKEHHHALTGMGINPFRKLNNNVPIENGRYKMLYNHLLSYPKYTVLPMYFHKYPNFGMFSSASQVQLDVNKEDIPTVISVFNRLEPIKAVLFSNSVMTEEQKDLLCCRDMLWEHSTHGINPHNVGMFDCEINSIDDLLSYLTTASIYCVERDGHYINFKPTKLLEYFNTKHLSGEYADHGKIISFDFTPQESDIAYLRTFKFEDLTFRGTVEFRSACCQPIEDVMTVAAFHTGLLHKTKELSDILNNDHVIYHNGYTPVELRKMFVRSDFPDFVDPNELYELIHQVLDLCTDGLRERGTGEEKYLYPLYERAKNKTNPAKSMVARLESGESIISLIQDYGMFNYGLDP